MKTPILDFTKNYISKNSVRLHMPGHKGCGPLGFEEFDITEIAGADSLYEADGIIKLSEQNASELFDCPTFYSTEGSSHCIRAMLYLVVTCLGKRPRIAAGRNAHKAFLSAGALIDFDIDWLTGSENYLCLNITPDYLENYFKSSPLPDALYLTSPDYLGNTLDITGISKVCKKYGVLLLIDNAHGAYQRFLSPSNHPIDLGADMCCDSAHKTLPALTGAAYLHVSKSANPYFAENAKAALSLFGSTSPSYLILQSLDALNPYLLDYGRRLNDFVLKVDTLKTKLLGNGFCLVGNEKLKITIATKPFGYLGNEVSDILAQNNIVAEFSDPDYLTLMLTPEIDDTALSCLEKVLLSLNPKPAIDEKPPVIHLPKKIMSPKSACMSAAQTLPIDDCFGKVLALGTVGCPPAVPIIASGEEIDENVINAARYYGIKNFTVVK